MEFNYRKNNNSLLFNEKNKSLLEIAEIQNYIPIYNNFFNLNDQNSSCFNLNYLYCLHDIKSKDSYNKYSCILKNMSTNE